VQELFARTLPPPPIGSCFYSRYKAREGTCRGGDPWTLVTGGGQSTGHCLPPGAKTPHGLLACSMQARVQLDQASEACTAGDGDPRGHEPNVANTYEGLKHHLSLPVLKL